VSEIRGPMQDIKEDYNNKDIKILKNWIEIWGMKSSISQIKNSVKSFANWLD
jgi:hypothetical protein